MPKWLRITIIIAVIIGALSAPAVAMGVFKDLGSGIWAFASEFAKAFKDGT